MTKRAAEKQTTMTSSWELLAKSVTLLTQNVEQALLLVLLPSLTLQLGALLLPNTFVLGVVVYAVGMLWLLGNAPALTLFELEAIRGRRITALEAYKRSWKFFCRIIAYNILFDIAVAIGFVLLVVPALLILRRFILTNYYIVDKDLSIRQAAKMSAAQSKLVAGYVWSTIGIVLLLGVFVAFIGLLLQGMPALASIVSSLLVLTYLFILPLRYLEVMQHATPAKKTTRPGRKRV